MSELSTNETQVVCEMDASDVTIDEENIAFVMCNALDSNYADVEIKSNGEILGKTRLMFF